MIVLHSFTLAEHYCVGHTMLSLERKGSDKEKKINHVSNVLIVTAQVVQRLMNKLINCIVYVTGMKCLFEQQHDFFLAMLLELLSGKQQ